MQLIHETQSAEDININMSTQAENPVLCDIADIKRDIANKENSSIVDDESISSIEKSLNAEIEATETILNEENPQNSVTNGSESNSLDELDILKDDELDIASKVTDDSTNGTSDSCIVNEIKCQNSTMEKSIIKEDVENVSPIKCNENYVNKSEKDLSTVEINEQLKLSKIVPINLEKSISNHILDVILPIKCVEATNTEKTAKNQVTGLSTEEKETTEDITIDNIGLEKSISDNILDVVLPRKCVEATNTDQSKKKQVTRLSTEEKETTEDVPIDNIAKTSSKKKCEISDFNENATNTSTQSDFNEEIAINNTEPYVQSDVIEEKPMNVTDTYVQSVINEEISINAMEEDMSSDTFQQNITSKTNNLSSTKNVTIEEKETFNDVSMNDEKDASTNETLKLEDIMSSHTQQNCTSITDDTSNVNKYSIEEDRPCKDATNNEEDNSSNETYINSKEIPNDITRLEGNFIDEDINGSPEEPADDLIDKEIIGSSEDPADSAITLKLKTDIMTEEKVVENTTPTYDTLPPKDVSSENEKTKASEVHTSSEDIIIADEKFKFCNDINNKETEGLTSLHDKIVDAVMDDLEIASTDEKEKGNSTISLDITANVKANFSDCKNNKGTENVTILNDKIVEVGMDDLEKAITDVKEKDISLISTVEPHSIIVNENKVTPSTMEETLKLNKCISMKESSVDVTATDHDTLPLTENADDIIMAEPAASIDVKDQNNKTNVESSLNANQENDVSSMAKITKQKEHVDYEVEDVPMEVDEIEIIDEDKAKRDSSKTHSNNVEITEPESKSVKINEMVDNTENFNKDLQITNRSTKSLDIDNITEASKENTAIKLPDLKKDKVEIIDEDDITLVEKTEATTSKLQVKETSPEQLETKTLPVVCKLSNTLDILSDDDEEEPSKVEVEKSLDKASEKQCINIDDDDDIMLIEDDNNSKEAFSNQDKLEVTNDKDDNQSQPEPDKKLDIELREKERTTTDISVLSPKTTTTDLPPVTTELDTLTQPDKISEEKSETIEQKKPLLPQNFLKTAKKNLSEMTRDELEEFCILRIVEGIVDRSNLSDIKTKIKTMGQNLEEYRKRAMMLTKQNRDLQVVLKSVQEEQKKRSNAPIQPLKITRSVGMQVLMNDKLDSRRKGLIPGPPLAIPVGRPQRPVPNVKNLKPLGTPTTIPVPRKVPVNNSPAKVLTNSPASNIGKTPSPLPNGIRNPSPVQKMPEKRTFARMQSTSSSVTVDLTDDEPPPKINNVPPVRVVPSQNLLSQQRPFTQPLNSPRKVYIPISGPQGQNIRPGQTLMVKGGPGSGPRHRLPMPRMQQSPIRVQKQMTQRHPAPLPDAAKQYTPPTWKALPPAPDLKLSKVENGIVISWKIDGYPEGGYETIASYQLYAYQETTAPPCTALWKKIGDVKALPLPMACTLTQFMAGFKYYFAVRAVDVRSRLGPFSLPGSILLLNKV